jgi:hypothetical protein
MVISESGFGQVFLLKAVRPKPAVESDEHYGK